MKKAVVYLQFLLIIIELFSVLAIAYYCFNGEKHDLVKWLAVDRVCVFLQFLLNKNHP
jgi:hypothetical protein